MSISIQGQITLVIETFLLLLVLSLNQLNVESDSLSLVCLSPLLAIMPPAAGTSFQKRSDVLKH